MREIKFRAWHVKDRVMLGHKDACLIPLFTPNFRYRNGETVLMQYVGLRDKNGVEIYDDDFVNVYYGGELLFAHHVKWSDADGGCSITVNHCDYDITTMAWAAKYFCYEYEVIGNIYETMN